MKKLFALLLALMIAAGTAHAQESITQQSMKNTVANEGLTKSLELLQAQVTSATDRLMLIKKCHEEGKFIGTLDNGKEDCINVIPSCMVPWSGATMKVGESITAYASDTVPFGESCKSEKRLCDPATGKLSGSYLYQGCTPANGVECALPWGGIISSTQTSGSTPTSLTSVVAYASATVPFGATCTSETRVCTNGTLSGSYTSPTCAITSPTACALPWGGTLTHSATVVAYSSTSVPYGQSCNTIQSTLSCSNGTLSGNGAYPYGTCTPATPVNCLLPWGGTLASGQSVVAYTASSAANCDAIKQTRTCTNGVLNGAGDYQTCASSCSTGTRMLFFSGFVTVPKYCTLKLELWGGGGGGGGVTAYNIINGSAARFSGEAGGDTSAFGLTAYGGAGGAGYYFANGNLPPPLAGGAGGNATGGTINLQGGRGGNGVYWSPSGAGGGSPNGGVGGASVTSYPNATYMGKMGTWPGGGGSGTSGSGAYSGAGGGAGGYAAKIFKAGELTPGTTEFVLVGSGGFGGEGFGQLIGGSGANGGLKLTWY